MNRQQSHQMLALLEIYTEQQPEDKQQELYKVIGTIEAGLMTTGEYRTNNVLFWKNCFLQHTEQLEQSELYETTLPTLKDYQYVSQQLLQYGIQFSTYDDKRGWHITIVNTPRNYNLLIDLICDLTVNLKI
jgi:hypothetical protein